MKTSELDTRAEIAENICPSNRTDTDSIKQRSFFTLIFAAGDE